MEVDLEPEEALEEPEAVANLEVVRQAQVAPGAHREQEAQVAQGAHREQEAMVDRELLQE